MSVAKSAAKAVDGSISGEESLDEEFADITRSNSESI